MPLDYQSVLTLSLNTIEVAKNLRNLIGNNPSQELTDKILELQKTTQELYDKLAEARMEYDKLYQEKQVLQGQLNAEEEWETTAEMYEYAETEIGHSYYKLKPQYAGKAAKAICPRCYTSKSNSILFPKSNGIDLTCHTCRLTVQLRKHPPIVDYPDEYPTDPYPGLG